jgi:ribosomal protein S18 acetylase RimI-like enzyme
VTPPPRAAEAATSRLPEEAAGLTVRDLDRNDVRNSALLHARVLDMEFVARLGPAFLRSYHRAWIDSPVALALAVDDSSGHLAGVLLGAYDTPLQVSSMLRGHGLRLALRMLAAISVRPGLAASLVRTRLARYARGVARFALGSLRTRRQAPGAGGATTVRGPGEVTHLFVDPARRGEGVGRALIDEAARRAKAAGLAELELVTPPDLAARRFYERLGWQEAGELTSRSGEPFIRYRLALD